MDQTENFKVLSRKRVCIQGLGFVGSAMALAVAMARNESGDPLYDVMGIDVSNEEGKRRVGEINKGLFPFENNDEKLAEAMTEAYKAGNLKASTDIDYYKTADVVIVDINLDISYKDGDPILDLEPFRHAIHTLGRTIKEGCLVIVETTVPPGTCEKIIYPIICEEFSIRGLDANKVYIAHSYERVMPGKNYFDSIVNFWRVYSGRNKESAEQCELFLKTVISTEDYPLTRLQSTTSTELAKVLENSYRATTIAFMEEWGRFAEAVGVDIYEIIDAIRMRPTHSNMRQPGFGVGGYCLTKDPYFGGLAAKDIFGLYDIEFPFSTQAVKTNNAMPLVSLHKIQNILGGSLNNKKILLMGVSYRQDVGDTRYSPSEIFVKEALKQGSIIECEDPLVTVWKETNLPIIHTIPQFIGYDVIIFTVQHKQYTEIDFGKKEISDGTLIFDANRVLSKGQIEDIKQNRKIKFGSIGR